MSKTIETIIRENVRSRVEGEFYCYEDKETLTRDVTERKIQAATYFAPLLKERFQDTYPSYNWEEIAAELAFGIYTSPDSQNKTFNYLYAIAIFILDELYMNTEDKEKLNQLIDILPKEDDFTKYDESTNYYFKELYDKFPHPYYKNEIIEAVTRIIAMRNMEYVDYSLFSQNEAIYVLDKYTTSFAKPEKNETKYKMRKKYEKMLSLINQKTKDNAMESFKKLFWSLIEKYLITDKYFKDKITKLEEKLDYSKFLLNEEREKNKYSNNSTIHKCAELKDRVCKLKFKIKVNTEKHNFFKDTFSLGYASRNAHYDSYDEQFENIECKDPYEILFGYLCLLEENSDYAWLLETTTATIGAASSALPWADYDKEFYDEGWSMILDDYQEELKKKHCFYSNNFYNTFHESNDLHLDCILTQINMAQMVYSYTQSIPARYKIQFPLIEELKSLGLSEKEILEAENAYLTSFYINNKCDTFKYDISNSLDIFEKLSTKRLNEQRDSYEKELAEQKAMSKKHQSAPNDKLENENKILQLEVERLRKKLLETNHHLAMTKKRIEKEKAQHDIEKQELFSLRELIFNRDNDHEQEEEQQDKYSWPYKVSKNIVVLGGHEEWTKKIKTLFTNVKFIGDKAPDKEMLKHTDILLLQTKAGLSHSVFYKVLDDAKTLSIPIRYFVSSGVFSSAKTIIEVDERD